MDDAATAVSVGLLAPDAVIRDGLRSILGASPDLRVVWDMSFEAGGLPSWVPPVIVADLDRATDANEQLIATLQQSGSATGLLIFSYGTSLDELRHALELGAKGYVLKSDPVEMLRFGVRAVARGQHFISPGLSGPVRDVVLTWGESALTQRERVVLSLIADGKSTKLIAQELHLSPRTVEVHRLHLLRKLEAHSSPELVRNAIRRGLLA